jgi:DnaJ-class molecular chaperone
MKNKNYSIIDQGETTPCWKCESTGLINGELCSRCHGEKSHKDHHYIITDEINKIAFDSDVGG